MTSNTDEAISNCSSIRNLATYVVATRTPGAKVRELDYAPAGGSVAASRGAGRSLASPEQ